MNATQELTLSSAGWSGWSLDRLFDTAGKNMVIRLRWPLVILSSYLLYYAESPWLSALQLQALLSLYLLSHAALYFVPDGRFASPFFCAPLLLFDTLVLLVVLEIGGAAAPDFVATCLLTLVLSCICQDTRGLLLVTFTAPLVYAFIAFNTTAHFDSTIYLRLPFPFAIALFYGYFGQVERLRSHALTEQILAQRQERANAEIGQQRQRLELLHEVNQTLSSALNVGAIVELFLERALAHLPYTAALIRLKNGESGELETVAAAGERSERLRQSKETLKYVDRVAAEKRPLIPGNVGNVRDVIDGEVGKLSRAGQLELFKAQGLKNILALPLMASDEALGVLVLVTGDEHVWNAIEIEFLQTLAGHTAMALDRAQLYSQRRRLAAQLRAAQRVNDEFLKSCSTNLKTPLNVVTGYTDMFRDGLLGTMTPIQEQAIEAMERQAKLLQGSIDALLSVSHFAAEAVYVEAHDLSLWELFSELRSAYDGRPVKEVKLLWDYSIDLPAVRSYRGKLKQVLTSLLDNAIEFTDHGAISIMVRYLPAQQCLQVRVAENNAGKVQVQGETGFERLWHASNDAVADRGGVTLGLYVVRKFTELLGGSIDVDSMPGVGAMFTLRIPAPMAQSSAVPEQLGLAAENNFNA
ncbi:MAG: GAF domain-containing protein [Deltaproteobacteria bacterium]|nr:GAF domain-containing protein [Deltaproteobacteria bacterium]